MPNSVNKQIENKLFEKIMGIFALLVLCVFPVVYHNYYFDILQTKYQAYWTTAAGMMVIMLVCGLYTNKLVEAFKTFCLKKWIRSLSVVDWALVIFWLANVVSWLLCRFRWEAFWGTSGRFNGVFLMTVYLIVYFMVTRFLVLKRSYLDAFLLVSIFVCLFGISDYFQMDLLGFKENMMEEQKAIYTSTFGNINTYTVYVAAVLCVSMILFVMETCKIRTVIYMCVMAIAMVALIVGASDNAYLSLAALFGLSPLVLFRRKSWIRRYLASVAMFLTSILFVGWINVVYADMVYGIDSIFDILCKLSVLPVVTVGLWAVIGVWVLMAAKKKEDYKDSIGNSLVYAWCAVIVFVLAAVVYVLYDANIAGNADKYAAFKNYVVFNDKWGTNRGYVWRCSVELYSQKFTFVQKLFGYGADTFKLLMLQHYPPRGNIVFDSAHNEYLHFLVTTGAVGMVSYIVFLGSSIVLMAKRGNGRPEVVAIMFVVLAYATQAVVNINLPVLFPIIWQLLAMGLCKVSEEENKLR